MIPFEQPQINHPHRGKKRSCNLKTVGGKREKKNLRELQGAPPHTKEEGGGKLKKKN